MLTTYFVLKWNGKKWVIWGSGIGDRKRADEQLALYRKNQPVGTFQVIRVDTEKGKGRPQSVAREKALTLPPPKYAKASSTS